LKIVKLLVVAISLILVLQSCKNRIPKKDAYIYYERTACFGNCPIFSFTLEHNGEATYVGNRFVQNIGTFSHTFSEEEVKNIFSQFEKGNWESFAEHYPTNYSDLPGKILGFYYKKNNKKVRMDGDHPAVLDALMEELDKMIAKADWVSTIHE
jgi:hypothetical protein